MNSKALIISLLLKTVDVVIGGIVGIPKNRGAGI